MEPTRRRLVQCAICAAVGGAAAAELVAEGVAAEAPAGGIQRIMLQRTSLPGDQFEVLLMAVNIPENGAVPRHTHPGVESTYLLEGGGTLAVKDQQDRILKPGDTFHIPTAVPHAWANGGTATKLVITYVVEKGKPVASPAPG